MSRITKLISFTTGLTGATMGCTDNDCFVSTPEEHENVPEICDRVHVVGWPTDELELTSSKPNRTLLIGAVEGAPGSEPFALRRVVTTAYGAVIGEATEEAELRDVVLPGVQAPVRVIEPRVFEEPCTVWAPDDPPDSMTGIGLGIVRNGYLRVSSDVPLRCLNVSMSLGRDLVVSGFDAWEGYTLVIEENARPVGLAQIVGSDSLRLEHLQQLGAAMRYVRLINVGDELSSAYASWLNSLDFSGVVEVCSVDEDGVMDVCSTLIPD